MAYWHYELKHPSTQDAVMYSKLVSITPQTSGRVTGVYVKPDQYVKKGELLFKIDDRQAKLNVQAAQIKLIVAEQAFSQLNSNLTIKKQGLQQAQLNLKYANKQYQRYAKLFKEKAISKSKLDSLKTTLLKAKASYQSAQNAVTIVKTEIGKPGKNTAIEKAKLALAQSQLALSYCNEKAPISGFLSNFNLEVGQKVNAEHVLFGINSTQHWAIHANILEPFLRNIKVGQRVTFKTRTNPGNTYHGIVSGIGQAIDISGWQSNQALPDISPAFQWVSVAKRFPVMIKVLSKDKNKDFMFGGSVSLTINTDSA